jgi:ABC-type multidrug transport system fused ATPase/permease subunit
VRKNLDPFNEFPEEEVWNALKETDLQELVQALPQKLDTFLPKNKNNFTCG